MCIRYPRPIKGIGVVFNCVRPRDEPTTIYLCIYAPEMLYITLCIGGIGV